MSASLAKQRPPAPLELVLWTLLFLLTYFLVPAMPDALGERGGVLALLPALPTLLERVASLAVLALLGGGGILLGERYLLLEKGERATMLLLLLGFFTTIPQLGLLVAPAMLVGWLLLFRQLGTYLETRAHRTYLGQGLLVGLVALLQPVYLLLLPVVLWGGYFLRSLALRSVVALFVGILLPVWIGGAVVGLQGEGGITTTLSQLSTSLALADPRGVSPLPLSGLPTYLLFVAILLLALLLYRQRYYRESVRHRDMTASLQLYPTFLLGGVPLLGWAGELLLPLALLPLALLLARGFSGQAPWLTRALRTLLLGLCLGVHLWRLGLVEALWRYLF